MRPPLQRRMQPGGVPGPLALVIFGATGDLARRKLLPALFRLHCEGLLPEAFALFGVAREPLSDAQFRQQVLAALPAGAAQSSAWHGFAERVFYVPAASGEDGSFRTLHARLAEADAALGTGGNRLFYLAVPPAAVAPVVDGLAGGGLIRAPGEPAWTRIVVEKPFGSDLRGARELNALLLRAFDESQVYRIDHYLGKETVQNLLVFRFANVLWEAVWNRQYVAHVQITVAEEVGVGTRAGYYDAAGALRDMVQSHLLQLLTLVAMEPPSSYDAESIRNEKNKVLCAVRRLQAGEGVVRGRYAGGRVAGEAVAGYLDEPGVDPASRTETFVALRLWIDNWRWAGVPFYLRTGKRLAATASEIAVHFRPAPNPILDTVEGDFPSSNLLVLRMQPEEGIALRFEAKVPGLAGPLRPVTMDFSYREAFGLRSPPAYERLLLDAMLGDATLFTRRDEVESAWALLTPVLEGFAGADVPPIHPYPVGSWGPAAAADLPAADGFAWHDPAA